MQSNKSISTNRPEYTAAAPIVLLLLGMLKEGLADFKRYRTDYASNSMPTEILTGKVLDNKPLERKKTSNLAQSGRMDKLNQLSRLETKTVRTEQLRVGDIIKVSDD